MAQDKIYLTEGLEGFTITDVLHYNCVGAIFITDVFPLPAPMCRQIQEKA